MNHTPGPWVVFPFHDGSSISIESLKFGDIAEVVLCRDVAVVTANAHLIAAAPDLLEACIEARRRLMNVPEGVVPDGYMFSLLSAAIAKATLPRQTDITSDVAETTLGVTGLVPEPTRVSSPPPRTASKPQYRGGCDATGRNLDTTV